MSCCDEAEVEKSQETIALVKATESHTIVDHEDDASMVRVPSDAVASVTSSVREAELLARLSAKAVDAHWRVSRKELVMKRELSKTLKSTLFLAEWRGTEVVVKCAETHFTTRAMSSARITSKGVSSAFSLKKAALDQAATQSTGLAAEDHHAMIEELLHEIDMMSKERHPDMVMFLGACLDQDAPIMCITEYMPGGDLERYYMAKRREKTTDVWCPPLWRIVEWCAAVARALAFLHHRDEPLIHRDLKPLNLLLNKHLEVKVADMGISKVMAATNNSAASYTMTGGVGSWLYMAPEVVRHEQYNEKVDIYAFALIMYFMSSGRAPFYQLGRDPELVLKEYLRGHEPRPVVADCHIQLRPIMASAWDVEERLRPTAAQLVQELSEVPVTKRSCLCSQM